MYKIKKVGRDRPKKSNKRKEKYKKNGKYGSKRINVVKKK